MDNDKIMTLVELVENFKKLMKELFSIENKKFYLINPETKYPGEKYLNAEFSDGQIVDIFFSNKCSGTEILTEFSDSDLEVIKRKYPKTFSICKIVEVKDDSNKGEE